MQKGKDRLSTLLHFALRNDGKSISGSAIKVGGLSGSASKVGVWVCSSGVAEAVVNVAALVGGRALRITAEHSSSCKGFGVGINCKRFWGLKVSFT